MTNISNSSIAEDRYLAHMAEMQGGKNIIGFSDRYWASSAQKHPIGNKMFASTIGLIKSSVVTSFALLAYPLMNSSTRSSILGSALDVCLTCGINVKTIGDLFYKVQNLVDPHKTQSYVEQTMEAYKAGAEAVANCATDDKALLACRAGNYAGGIVDMLSDNYMLVTAAAVGLFTWFSYSKMNTYAKKELATEVAIKKDLTNRYGKIATRLAALESNQEVQACAKNILQRQLEINQEIERLNLPNLTWKDIENITQPVFEAAEKKQS